MNFNTSARVPWIGRALIGVGIVLGFAAASGLTFGTVAAARDAAADPDFAAIDRFVESERLAMGVPGVAIGVVRDDQVVHLAGFGQADPTGRPVTAQTPMVVASLTKSFTAMATMQLVEAGRIDLDAPVQRYLSWFRVADADASSRITVRHLLNQTSGLPSLVSSAGLVGGDMDDQALERAVGSLASVPLSQPVGSTYQYSNFNYWTLGALIQAVSGQTYEHYLEQRLLEPLDMRRSFTSQAAARQRGLAAGYRFWFGVPVATDLTYSRAFVSAGGLVSTSEDLTHYLIAQLNGGRFMGASVLSAAGVAEQQRGVARIGDTDDYYGMGWLTGTIEDVAVVRHDGELPTGYAELVLIPDRHLGIAVLANGGSRVAAPRLGGLAPGIANVLVGKPPLPATENRLFEALTILSFVIVASQGFGILLTMRRIRRWRRLPDSRPVGRRSFALHIVIPGVLNLAWAAVVLLGLPLAFTLSLADSMFLLGDFAYVLVGSALIALLWGPVRTLLVWRALHAFERAEMTAVSVPARPATSEVV